MVQMRYGIKTRNFTLHSPYIAQMMVNQYSLRETRRDRNRIANKRRHLGLFIPGRAHAGYCEALLLINSSQMLGITDWTVFLVCIFF